MDDPIIAILVCLGGAGLIVAVFKKTIAAALKFLPKIFWR